MTLAACLALSALAAAAWPGRAWAQERTLVFLTAKTGDQTVGGSLFNTLEAAHGTLQESKQVTRRGLEADIYAITRHRYGLALSMEVMDFRKTFTFQNPAGAQTPERLNLDARSFLYTLEGFLRFDTFLLFAGAGSGTYYVSYDEKVSQLSFLDASTGVFSYRAGFRWLVSRRLSMLFEAGEVDAPIHVFSNNRNSTLQLGGTFINYGVALNLF